MWVVILIVLKQICPRNNFIMLGVHYMGRYCTFSEIGVSMQHHRSISVFVFDILVFNSFLKDLHELA